MRSTNEAFDVLVIGAGIAGLISACRLAQGGKQVLLVEKLSFLGGRFSAFPYNGAEVSSGAFHTFPHGGGGPMAQALKRVGINIEITKPAVIASIHVRGQEILLRTILDFFKVLPSFREKITLVRLFSQAFVQKNYPGSFGSWLVSIGCTPLMVQVFDRFCQFALSASVLNVPYEEGRQIMHNIIRYGLPGIPKGGARAVVQELQRTAAAAGVTIWKTTQVERLEIEPATGKVRAAHLHERRKDQRLRVKVTDVISTIGLQSSLDLLKQSGVDMSEKELSIPTAPAIGLKIHILSPIGLIDHDSIMFCLQTRRVAGILQATNSDPNLAPRGKHLLISHQMIAPGSNWQEEKKLALQDWQDLFGEAFLRCTVIGVSIFPERFPVNWAAQGCDLRSQPFGRHGIWLSGDGMKPLGFIMVEGVAASAEAVSETILNTKRQ
jgi:phytoene dehydrogenase-like protein